MVFEVRCKVPVRIIITHPLYVSAAALMYERFENLHHIFHVQIKAKTELKENFPCQLCTYEYMSVLYKAYILQPI